jgi:hypothetical protein
MNSTRNIATIARQHNQARPVKTPLDVAFRIAWPGGEHVGVATEALIRDLIRVLPILEEVKRNRFGDITIKYHDGALTLGHIGKTVDLRETPTKVGVA